MSKKIGFWPVFSIVTGSQIGTGAFLFPATLSPFGFYSFFGWLLAGVGAVCLACVFANLSSIYSKNGGPHIYVEKIFGKNTAFFVGWTYWVISWVSTSVVVILSISFFKPFLGVHSEGFYVFLQILLLFSITYLNISGVAIAGKVEFVLTLLKLVPLIIVPIISLYYFDSNNISLDFQYESKSHSYILAQVISITLWGFIGLESATCSTSSVKNPSVTIPMAIVIGTSTVAVLYLFNSIAIMGMIPSKELSVSTTPYIIAIEKIAPGNWYLLIALISSISCIGSLNAWMMTSGQISLNLAEEGYFPKFFSKINKQSAPYVGLIIPSLLILPLLLLTADENILNQLKKIIDFSVTAFLYVYLICSISYIFIHIKSKNISFWKISSTIIAIIFCVILILKAELFVHMIVLSFIASGIPLFILNKRKTIR